MAEMKQYDEIQARAYEITEPQRREEHEDNDIIDSDGGGTDSDRDSDLSMLVGSRFNGIEGIGGDIGIEIGSEISGGNGQDVMDGIEVEGTGQDGQGDQEDLDGKEGQDSERMDGIEGSGEVHIDIEGESEIQGPVFSPRKTRSGRVVKYTSEE